MTKPILNGIFFIFTVLVSSLSYSQVDSISKFTDYKKILGFGKSDNERILKIDSFSIDWAKKVLDELNLSKLTNFEKALKIRDYIHKNIKCYKRQVDIHGIIVNKTGNCWDHARISAFLLRMAGVPAKFAFEINLKKNVYWWGKKAKKQNNGTWGFYHNDHVWVLFFDGKQWQPYDSELNILGIEDFVNRRFGKISPYYFKMLPYGPPFIIWEDTGQGFSNMRTITKQIWSYKTDNTYAKVNKSDWYSFLSNFEEITYDKLNHNLFPKDMEKKIKDMCKIWF
jgi:hypothetical protein